MGPGWLDDGTRWQVEDVLAALDEVVRRTHIGSLTRRPIVRDGWHPGRTVVLELDGVEVGVVGQLHPHASEAWDLPDPVVAGELLLEVLLQPRASAVRVPALAPRLVRHPAVVVDVAVVAAEDVTVADVVAVLRSAVGELLDELRWFDEFRGAQLPDGHRSVAFRLRLQDPDRQLSDADAEAVLARISAAVATIGASLRT